MNQSQKAVPTVAFIGPPNSGKSSIINRICGKKTAIVANEAHTTRDLNIGYEAWEGLYMRFVDTGGLVPDPEDIIQSEVQIRSWGAMAEADILVWVMDKKVDPETISDKILTRLWKTGKPFVIAVNKVDDPNQGREEWEFVRMGAQGMINMSAMNGYGINTLLDWIVEYLTTQKGYKTGNYDPLEDYEEEVERRKGKRMRKIKISKEGKIFDYEEQDAVVDSHKTQELKYKNLILDVDGVLVRPAYEATKNLSKILGIEEKEVQVILNEIEQRSVEFLDSTFLDVFELLLKTKLTQEQRTYLARFEFKLTKIDPEWQSAIMELKKIGVRIILATSYPFVSREEVLSKIYPYYSSRNVGANKYADTFFSEIIKSEKINPNETLYIDDKMEFVELARKKGLVAQKFTTPSDVVLSMTVTQIQAGKKTPKLLILGRPNVGKSTLTNALLGEKRQIVSDVAGTTLSVSEYDLEFGDEHYKLLDTVGVRKPGQRTFGAESFATFRTIEAAHDADVILLVFDATSGITAQDQLVAGIARDTKASIVVIANKADQLTPDRKEAFMKDFQFKLQFLKVEDFVWFSAEQSLKGNTEEWPIKIIWKAFRKAVHETTRVIHQEEVRKLFNYLMKQKPPKKLKAQKKAVIYNLEYVSAHPHTFHLIVKEKKAVHWSYVRFIENMLKQQFDLKNTPVKIKLIEPE